MPSVEATRAYKRRKLRRMYARGELLGNPDYITPYEPPVKPKKRRHKKWGQPLPPDWELIRAKIILRDKVCQGCGGEGRAVHHKDKNRLNNDRSNLVYLCDTCHFAMHH
jgi:hypothetical protein